MKASFAVVGLGKFGRYVAMGLIEHGEHIIACDNNELHIKDFKDLTDEIYVLDSTDKEALAEAGIKGLDIVIVSIGENIEASILSVIALQELKNQFIIAKAVSREHAIILERLGVNLVIRPEKDASAQLLRQLLWNQDRFLKINDVLEIVEMPIEAAHEGQFLQDLEKALKMKTHQSEVRVIAFCCDGEWRLSFENPIVKSGDVLLLLYSKKDH
ncbi:potassium channel family protein [Helicobacter pametensis]|uniref:potassium channel family protein n=1 Tax=Helicobacter pametensis TaxID=95149 RepID=UPI000480DDC0|nr:TrkA family potassium uptake protein [Helicobacter pametensis]